MSQQALLSIGVTALAVFASVALILFWGRRQPTNDQAPHVRFLGAYSPLLTWLRYRRLPVVILSGLAPHHPAGSVAVTRVATETVSAWPQRSWLPRLRGGLRAPAWRSIPWPALLELSVLSAFALWVGRVYLTSDNTRWLVGDWYLNVQGYYPWTLLTRCGACVMWNGSLNGGYPSFVELVAAMLHPAAVAAVLLLGPLPASKLIAVMGLLMSGWAQWWLGRSLKLSTPTRLWTAAIAITGSHLAGRLASGLTEEVFSVGAASLALAAAVDLALTGRRRSVGALGLTLGLAVLAGQGYMQIALVACLFPGLLIFCFNSHFRLRPLLRSFLVAGVLAVLVSAVLWLPLLHFWPNFSKPTAEADYASVQSPGPLLLNLVMGDPDFYAGLERAGFIASPSWSVNYIGWLPVLLALVGLRLATRRYRRPLAYIALSLSLLYLVAGATLLRWLAPALPGLVTLLRTPSVMTSMAVPLLLLLSGLGLDGLWQLTWPRLALIFNAPAGRSVALNLRWLLLVPLAWSLNSTYTLGQRWMVIDNAPVDYFAQFASIDTGGGQWVDMPFGETGLVTVGLEAGLKASNAVRPWSWRGREQPPEHLRLTRDAIDPADPYIISAGSGHGLTLLSDPSIQYAAVTLGTDVVACQSTALGGNIDVFCNLPEAGQLVVTENGWTGWTAAVDGQAVALAPSQWLSVPAPAGAHHFQFRYRPWDVPVGVGLALLGVAGCLALLWGWRWPIRPSAPPASATG